MIYLVAFVALVLATARITRLIYFDDITARMRMGIDTKFGRQSFLSQMVWCPWCAGVWASLFICAVALAAAWIWWSWNLGAVITMYIPVALAVSYPAAWIVDLETSRTSRGD